MAKTQKPAFRLVTKGDRTYIYLTRWNVCIGELYTGVTPADAQKVIDSLTIKQSRRNSADSRRKE
jgi:(2Fe-2S) ferredoxin